MSIVQTSPKKAYEKLKDFVKRGGKDGLPKILAVVGPTASGKTGLGVEIAKWCDGEVISMDSRQVYKGMDIGTAKVTEEEAQGVVHHMIDVVEPSEEFTLVHYKEMALGIIKDIQKRGKMPILVGGTGLYYSAIVDNFQVPRVEADWDLRLELEVLAQNEGVEAVHEILKMEDPEAAKKIHPNNLRYVIRAIEIGRAADPEGKKIQGGKGEKLFDNFTLAIDWPRDVLYERINKRVGVLVKEGLLEEVKGLLDRGLTRENSVAMASHGYQEIVPYFKGERSLEECLEEVRKNTRNYAKRQYTWFRREKDVWWVSGEKLGEMVGLI